MSFSIRIVQKYDTADAFCVDFVLRDEISDGYGNGCGTEEKISETGFELVFRNRGGSMNEQLRITIVEDDAHAEATLRQYLKRYGEEEKCDFSVVSYQSGEKFLKEYDFNTDIILMDIELPKANGMETVRKLRKKDSKVVVIFVTNLAQYAVEGYSVDAFDFIVKPVTYYNFAMKLKRGIMRLQVRREMRLEILLKGGGKKYVQTSEIKYIEIMNHTLCFHTVKGNFTSLGSMAQISEQLKDFPFALCNRCYLVNFRFIEGIDQFEVTVGGEKLQVSHLKRKDFMQKFNYYLMEEPFSHD